MIYGYDYTVKEKATEAGQWRSRLFPVSVICWKPSHPPKLIFKKFVCGILMWHDLTCKWLHAGSTLA